MSSSPALTITLLGTGSPLPDAHRAGPATLISAGGEVGDDLHQVEVHAPD